MKLPTTLLTSILFIYSFWGHANSIDNAPKNLFSDQNKGLIKALDKKQNLKDIAIADIKRVYNIHWQPNDHQVTFNIEQSTVFTKQKIAYNEGRFVSFDGVNIPFYEIFPANFDKKITYPAVILYSGHGNMDQLAFQTDSYQKGFGLLLAQQGFLVYVMENRGMGKLSFLGDHLRIDAVARIVSGSWYGQITTDALYFSDFVFNRSYTNDNIGVGGVSTGGALSLLVGAIDKRVVAIYVQGYLGSYATTFGTRANHCICNNIYNIVNEFDMDDIGKLIYPRTTMYVNGEQDTFFAIDAIHAFKRIKQKYANANLGDRVTLQTPKNTPHELSTSLASQFFNQALIHPASNNIVTE